MIRLALLDDHPAIRAGLSAIIAVQPDLQLAAVAGADALGIRDGAIAARIGAIAARLARSATAPADPMLIRSGA
jgi:DNA-binding NarL/FixJ family response regulator